MRQAFDECSSFRFRETLDRVHEVYVGLPTLQERDELLAQRLIMIFRLVFLFLDPFVFFLHDVFLFLREKQLLRRVRNRILRRFHKPHIREHLLILREGVGIARALPWAGLLVGVTMNEGSYSDT